jgi:hypothetical protein
LYLAQPAPEVFNTLPEPSVDTTEADQGTGEIEEFTGSLEEFWDS